VFSQKIIILPLSKKMSYSYEASAQMCEAIDKLEKWFDDGCPQQDGTISIPHEGQIKNQPKWSCVTSKDLQKKNWRYKEAMKITKKKSKIEFVRKTLLKYWERAEWFEDDEDEFEL
jgi:hypothetical protein